MSRPAQQIVSGTRLGYRELGRFRRSVNLLASPLAPSGDAEQHADASLITLVTPDVGNGPFHVVVAALPPALPKPSPAFWQGEALRISPWSLVVSPRTLIWEPAPSWSTMTISDIQFARLQRLVTTEQSVGAAKSTAGEVTSGLLAAGLDGMLQALASSELESIGAATVRLAGLGPGLTPAGDDILAGVLLALYAAHHPDRARIAEVIYIAAASRTTTLSRAFLVSASRGEAMETWHRLLAALCGGTPADLEAATGRVLAFGATSGPSMLQGFISAFARLQRVVTRQAHA